MCRGRDAHVIALVRAVNPTVPILCLGTADNGSPLHPLFLARDTKLVPWVAPAPKQRAPRKADRLETPANRPRDA